MEDVCDKILEWQYKKWFCLFGGYYRQQKWWAISLPLINHVSLIRDFFFLIQNDKFITQFFYIIQRFSYKL